MLFYDVGAIIDVMITVHVNRIGRIFFNLHERESLGIELNDGNN